VNLKTVVQALLVMPMLGQELIVFPAQGQSEEQMANDKNSCFEWAVKVCGGSFLSGQRVWQ